MRLLRLGGHGGIALKDLLSLLDMIELHIHSERLEFTVFGKINNIQK